jgi:hypothetical protein
MNCYSIQEMVERIIGWREETEGRPHFYLMCSKNLLIPVHVTSIRNGRVVGHTCWLDHCPNDRDGGVTSLWPEQVRVVRVLALLLTTTRWLR